MLSFGAQVPDISGKVGQIEGDDHTCAAANSGGQDVPVVPIGQLHRFDQRLIARHKRIRRRLVHMVSSAFQFVSCGVGTILEEIA